MKHVVMIVFSVFIFLIASCYTPVNRQDDSTTAPINEDNTPPADVTGINFAAGDKQVTLNWTEPVDTDFTEVEIAAVPSTTSIKVSKGTNSNTITGLSDGTKYQYTIKTIDKSGNKSAGVLISAYTYESGLSFTKTVSGGKCAITGYSGTNRVVYIPSAIEGNAVIAIANSAFTVGQGPNVTNVVIPPTVTNIGNFAFSGCTNLTGMVIPSGVASIGNDAFSGCTSLTDIALPSTLETNGTNVFEGCTRLTSISIPQGFTITESVFSNCTKLASVTLSEGIGSIGASAFRNCSALININIPSTVTSISVSAFQGCSSLASITLPSLVN